MRRVWVLIFATALIALLLAPMASAGKGGTDRPFTASFVGQATFTFPDSCPSSGCDEFTSVADATGPASHLGWASYHSTHHPYDFTNPLDGAVTITAANGDTLFGVYDYDLFSESPGVLVTFVGGTGRFADATGTAILTYDTTPQFQEPPCRFDYCLNPYVPWPWSATLTGTISY